MRCLEKRGFGASRWQLSENVLYHRARDESMSGCGPKAADAFLGRACPLCPGISDVNLFSYRKRVIDLNAEVSDGAFDFDVPEQELNGS